VHRRGRRLHERRRFVRIGVDLRDLHLVHDHDHDHDHVRRQRRRRRRGLRARRGDGRVHDV
jgi:hypothetical protein